MSFILEAGTCVLMWIAAALHFGIRHSRWARHGESEFVSSCRIILAVALVILASRFTFLLVSGGSAAMPKITALGACMAMLALVGLAFDEAKREADERNRGRT